MWTNFQPPARAPRLISVTVAELTLTLGTSATSSMADAADDAETTRLARLAQNGDPAAFGALIDLHHRAALRVARSAVGQLGEADEAVQDACLTAWRRIDTLDDPAAFRAWLLRITWRKALDRRRSVMGWLQRLRRDPADAERVIELMVSPEPGPDRVLLGDERARAIAKLIRALPPRLRDPFLLAASGEQRYEDIAALLGVPVGTVKWRVSEARRMLREKLERLGFGDPR